MGVDPLRFPAFRLNRIAEVPTFHTETHRYVFHARTSLSAVWNDGRDTWASSRSFLI